MLPRHHLHRHIGRHVIIHTYTGDHVGQLQSVTDRHAILVGARPAHVSSMSEDGSQVVQSFGEADRKYSTAFYGGYGYGANLAIPIASIIGLTAIGLGSMGGMYW